MRPLSSLTTAEKENLTKDIKTAKILKIYNALVMSYKYRNAYKWLLGITFILAFLGILAEKPNNTLIVINAICWIPGFIYVFGMAPIHMLVAKKLRNLTKKYNLVVDSDGIPGDLLEYVDDVLASK